MPTYDYVCDACEHAFEEFQSMTAKVLRKCPECGKPKLRRLIGTGAGVIFKGGGFYETDYRSDSYQKDAKADKPAETQPDDKPSDSGKPETSTADSKPKEDVKKTAPAKGAEKKSQPKEKK